MALNGMTIEPVSNSDAGSSLTSLLSPLQNFQWHKIYIANRTPEYENSETARTVESEHLRLIARHTLGCIADRLNLDKGQMRFRLSCTEDLTVQLVTHSSYFDNANSLRSPSACWFTRFLVILRQKQQRVGKIEKPRGCFASSTVLTY